MTRVHRALEMYYINIHRQTSKTGQHLQCTCAKCRIALFLARVTCSRVYRYYILYIGVIGRLTKMLEIEIVITVGMQFRVGFGGSRNAVYRKCVTPVTATRLGCDYITSWLVVVWYH